VAFTKLCIVRAYTNDSVVIAAGLKIFVVVFMLLIRGAAIGALVADYLHARKTERKPNKEINWLPASIQLTYAVWKIDAGGEYNY
jgi:hypothetical protein